ncbi:MAG: translation elongation factor Ts [Oscillospiraceae bacterium]|nr:translation elongation factor Ts [Oscillospiraceae bacterium]
MANITAKEVAELRDMTGCGLMDCKKALIEADGNRDEAVKILREKGQAKAVKKAGRIAAEGVVKTKVNGNKGVIVEINCETDFAAKSDRFLEMVEVITDTILNSDAADVEALGSVTAAGTSMTVSEFLTEKIATIGENIKIRRFTRMEGVLVPYMHDGGRLGTLVKLATDKPDDAEVLTCGKNVALQITAMNPQYVDKDAVPADVLANEKEVQMKLVEQEGKPANVAEKIVEGRMRKFYEEVCLVDQKYFKDDSVSIGKYVDSVAKAQGASLKVESFVRYERGEGIEKKEDNFADEVASMIK